MEEYKVEDEISLKELLTILIQGWKFIAGVVMLGALLAIIYSFMIVKPVYETSTELFMNIPEATSTEVGSYQYPSSNAHDYFELINNAKVVNKTLSTYSLESSKESFVNSLYISQEKDLNTVTVTYKGGNPEEIAKVLDGHILNYQRYLSYQFKEDAINKFLTEGKVSLSLKKEQLLKTKGQLSNAEDQLGKLLPTIPLQKALTTNPEIAAKYARDNGLTVAELSNQLLIEEIINSNYTAVERLVNTIEISIGTLELEITSIQKRLTILANEQLVLSESDVFEAPQSEFLNILSLPIKQVASANVPFNRVSPKRSLNVAIAIVLSGMIAVFIVFFRAYWEKN